MSEIQHVPLERPVIFPIEKLVKNITSSKKSNIASIYFSHDLYTESGSFEYTC